MHGLRPNQLLYTTLSMKHTKMELSRSRTTYGFCTSPIERSEISGWIANGPILAPIPFFLVLAHCNGLRRFAGVGGGMGAPATHKKKLTFIRIPQG